jgi:hypothetical protein
MPALSFYGYPFSFSLCKELRVPPGTVIYKRYLEPTPCEKARRQNLITGSLKLLNVPQARENPLGGLKSMSELVKVIREYLQGPSFPRAAREDDLLGNRKNSRSKADDGAFCQLREISGHRESLGFAVC